MRRTRLLIPLLLFVFSGFVHAQEVSGIRIGHTPGTTRLVLDLTHPASNYDVMNDTAEQLSINLPGFRWAFDLTSLSLEGTPFSRVWHEGLAEDDIHLRISLNRSLKVHAFTLRPYMQRGHRLVIDLQEVEAPDEIHSVTTQMPAGDIGNHPGRSPTESGVQVDANLDEREHRSNPAWSLSGTWEQEWAVETENISNQKFEAMIEPRLDIDFAGGVSATGIARLRLDLVGDLGPGASRPSNYSAINGPLYNSEYAGVSLRELYFDGSWGEITWRAGKQQIIWGQADGIKVLDVVNPQSFREFILDDFDDSRIPLWSLKLDKSFADNSNLQLLWIPDTTYHEFAEPGTPYFLTSPKQIPEGLGTHIIPLDPDTPDDLLGDSDAGIRLSTFMSGWDLSLNYLYHYQDTPALYQYEREDGARLLLPDYERSHLLGASFGNAFGDFALRGELVYSSDTFHTADFLEDNRGITASDELAFVLGTDWQLSSDTYLSGQWFYSYLPDYTKATIREKDEQILSLMYQAEFNNAEWQLRMFTLYSVNDGDSLFRVKLKYWYRSDLELWLSADVFGGDEEGLFGQFNERDRVILGARYGF